jgi:AraC family transcriptional regulator
MNAPYDAALMWADCAHAPRKAIDASELPRNVARLSSQTLGWYPLNIERRELEPGGKCLPLGVTEHLLFVNLADGHTIRESHGKVAHHQIKAGEVSIWPANRPVRLAWDTRLSFIMLTLAPEFLERVADEVFDLDPSQAKLMAVEGKHDPIIAHIAGNLVREVMNSDAGSRFYVESTANALAVHLLRTYTGLFKNIPVGQIAIPPRAVTRAIDFIKENYAKNLTLSDMAAAVHLSASHFPRVFKKATGMSPRQYLMQVRVHTARSLLSAGAGERSIAEVADAVGFADQSHLTRHFKRALGVTPKQSRL